MAGSAVLTMVESSVCMKKPVATNQSRKRSDLSGADVSGGILESYPAASRKRRSIGQVLHDFRHLSDGCTVRPRGEYRHSNRPTKVGKGKPIHDESDHLAAATRLRCRAGHD